MTTPKKLNYLDMARRFVVAEKSRQMTPEALQAALTFGVLLKGVRGELNAYAEGELAIQIRPDDVAKMMPPGHFEALHPEHKKKLRRAIREEHEKGQQVIRHLQAIIDSQCAAMDNASPAFQAAYDAHYEEYSTPSPSPQPIAA